MAKKKARGFVHMDDAARLADLVQAMDEWLSRGELLPEDWRKR